LSFWDPLIVAAARAAGCDRILSEDLTDGELYGSVTVVNPFRHDPGCGTGRPARKGDLPIRGRWRRPGGELVG
jgi:hypothetical protein